MRYQSVTRGSSSAFLLGLAASGMLAACSAGGGSAGLGSGQNTGGQGFGATGNVGNGTGGGFITGNGGDVSFLGSGGDTTMGTGGGSTTVPDGGTSIGLFGPPVTDTCGADTGKFANPSAGGKLLYPYDQTVFPRGLGGPLLMWDVQADQVLIQAKSGKFSWTACPMTPDKVRFQLPNDMWKGAGSYSDGPGDPLTVTITPLVGGKPTGPIVVHLKFALTTLKGAIYYNTYGSQIQGAVNNGAVLKLLPGDAQPTLFLTDTGSYPLGPCRSCHALSANGTTMTANHHTYPNVLYESELYDITGPKPNLLKNGIAEAGFAGIYPDGSRIMTNGVPSGTSASAFFPKYPGGVTALVSSTSKMLDPKLGQPITINGWDAPHAQMPMFSPDGKHIAYNDYDKGQGHSLFVADFDAGSNTFSNQKQIFNDPKGFAGWPFWTADSTQVVFQLGNRDDYSSQVVQPIGFGYDVTGRGHLMLVDVASGKAVNLDAANGYRNGQSYLPAGAARDNELEFYPTVSPIAGGGFSWALFASRRTYGNLWVKDIEDPTTKKIWVTAIGLGMPAGTDPSNPPFYLPGQELTSGNIRAFAALEPCKEDGQACSAGSECCKGICSRINAATGIGLCGQVPDGPKCSNVDNKCTTDADCCTGADNGVGGKVLHCISTAGSAYCGITLQ